MGIEFRILGPLEVLKDGQAVQLGTRMQRALLAVLLLRANEVTSTDRLIEDLWPDQAPTTALRTLRAYVSRLRRALDDNGSRQLRTVGSGYRLEVAPDALDRDRFEHLLDDARRAGDSVEASGLLTSALGLWRGPVLADLAYQPFAQAEVTRLEELRLLALEDRIETDIELGRHAEVVGEIRSLVGEHPFRERLWAALMLALYRCGRQAEALEVYRKARTSLVEELGLEPGPALREIEAAILRQDSSLEPRPTGDAIAKVPVPERGESPEPASPPTEVRKTVTVVFCDVAGSTSLGERHDPEALREVMTRYFDDASDAFRSHGGTVERFIGDAVMAVFGIPVLHEDDALRAVRAAWELSRRLSRLNDELDAARGIRLEIRIGMNTGEVVAGGDATDQKLVTGDPVKTAAHFQQAADPGMILIGEDTYRLVAGAVRAEQRDPMPIRGRRDLVRAFSVIDVAAEATAFGRRLEAPLVGRRSELAQLRQAFDRSARERAGFLFTVIGPPGIGKTRLALTFERALSGIAKVLTGRCLSYGEGITYWPIREVLDAAFEGDPVGGIGHLLNGDPDVGAVVETIASALGSSAETSTTGEAGWALRKVFEALAREAPLVVVFEDIHWGEPTFLDLVDRVADLVSNAPVMVLCLARPELLETRPAWGGGKLNAATTLLEPLTDDESALLLRRLATLDEQSSTEILRRAEGNPLFIEQLLAAAAEVGSSGDQQIPPTIERVLAARIDRLPPEERAVIERAAVVGKELETGAIEDLLPDETPAAVAERLDSLVHKQFLRRARPAADRGPAFAFRHVLIQLVAYGSIPKGRRADLHERLAGWIERRGAGDRVAEYEEIVGYHLEQAHRYVVELGPLGERSRALGDKASSLLAKSGRAALDRGDMPAALNLLSRALALAPADTPARPGLLVDLSLALGLSGRFDDEAVRLEEAAASAQVAGDRRVGSLVAIRKIVIRMRLSSTPIETLLAELTSMFPDLEEAGEHRVLGEAWEHVGVLQNWFGRSTEAEQALERAVKHARAAGDRRGEVFRLGILMNVIVDGPTPVEEAIARLPLLFERSGRSKVTESRMLRNLCTLQAISGDIAEARRSWRRSRELHRELGIFFTAHMILGYAELAAGDPAEAEGPLREGIADCEMAGETGYLGTTGGVLAEVLWRVGKAEEAERYAQLSHRLAAPDDWVGQWQWRGTLAKVLADRDQLSKAETLARAGASMIDQTDQPRWRGDARMSLAYVLRKAGRAQEAETLLHEALDLYERKGDVADASKARAELEGISRTN